MAAKSFEDLDLSKEEIKRIETALKDEKFRKLFVEYAEEISNPENRMRYEQEIAMMEQERGMDVQFVNPKPGHVIKTTLNGSKKAFINICTSDKIEKPKCTKSTNNEGKRGLHWQIPHSFSPPREDYDKSKTKDCIVYDVVFHPDTYSMIKNLQFRKLVEDTAIEGIEKQFDVRLDRNNLRHPKLKYKGTPVATVIRTRLDTNKKVEPLDENDPLKGMPYPYGDKTSAELAKEKDLQAEKRLKDKANQESKTKCNIQKEISGYTCPKYTITHRTDLDLQEFRNAPDARPSTRPKELVVTIELPLCKSAAGIMLDIFEEKLKLQSEKPAYKLELKLPYQVNDDMGSAKFDKSKKCLVVTLPVIPGEVPKMPTFFDDPMKDHDNSDLPPLIEELPALEKESCKDSSLLQVDSEKLGDDSHQAVVIDDPSTVMSNTDECKQADISYILPHYNFNQDSESITFIFYVRNVSADTLSISFPSNGAFQTKFKSVGSGGFPMYYSFYASFGEGFKLVVEDFIKDVSDKNLTVTLLKLHECQTMWDKFYAGVNEKNVEEQLFLTTDNLQLNLDKLQSEGEKMVHADEQTLGTEATQIKVTEMNQKKLTLQITKREACLNEEDELDDIGDSAQYAANIEVIHTTPPPDIQGILKQRSVSESSETSSGDSPTGTSPRDSDGTKRSVTFNSQIDKTTFKVNASVKSMQQALKSKRRRNRKKEEKQKEKSNRRRHNSNGSEGSSCDDADIKHSSESLSEEDHEQDDTVENFEETGTEIENFNVMNDQKSEKIETSVKGLKETCGEEMKGKDVKHDEVVCKQPGYQIHFENKNEMERKSKLVSQINNKMAKQKQEKDIDDSDDDEMKAERTCNVNGKNDVMTCDENDKEMLHKTSGFSDNNKNGKKSDLSISIDAKSKCDNGSVGMASKGPDDSTLQQRAMKITNSQKKGEKFSTPKISVVDQAAGGNDNEKNKESLKNDVETDLSWKEVDRNDPNNEHKTRCAVNFSNDVMFDLDIN